MDIDKISMTALLILMIIGFVIAFGTYLMIVSENMNMYIIAILILENLQIYALCTK